MLPLAVDLLTCIHRPRLAVMIAARRLGFSVKNALEVRHSPKTKVFFPLSFEWLGACPLYPQKME